MKFTEDSTATCPFYLKETGNRLVCEGISSDSSSLTYFRNGNSKNSYKRRYCRANYKTCALCIGLMSKYE